jgi:hypothetical protein
MLLQGTSDADVADAVGVDRTTIFRWRNTVAFAREIDRQRRLRRERADNRLQSMLGDAVEVLKKQLESADPRLAVRAAHILLRYGVSPARRRVSGVPRPDDSEAVARAEQKRFGDDLIAYIEAPVPGQPGAPEDLPDDLDDEENPTE